LAGKFENLTKMFHKKTTFYDYQETLKGDKL